MTHGVCRIQTVRNGEGVEHTIVSDFKHCFSFLKIHVNAGGSNRGRPKQSRARDPEVVGVWARRAQTVDSKESEVAFVLHSVITQEHSGHEPTIGVEIVFCFMPVFRSVPVPVKFKSASPMNPLKS